MVQPRVRMKFCRLKLMRKRFLIDKKQILKLRILVILIKSHSASNVQNKQADSVKKIGGKSTYKIANKYFGDPDKHLEFWYQLQIVVHKP